MRLELTTSSLGSDDPRTESPDASGVASGSHRACTNAWAANDDRPASGGLQSLADALLALDPDERKALVDLIMKPKDEDSDGIEAKE